jgi:hypothetical protein
LEVLLFRAPQDSGREQDFQSWTRVLESRSLNPNSGGALGVRVPVGAVQAKSAFKSPNAVSSTACGTPPVWFNNRKGADRVGNRLVDVRGILGQPVTEIEIPLLTVGQVDTRTIAQRLHP